MVEQADQIDIVYLGNPIVDVSAEDPNKTLMEKYKLEIGMATLATPEQIPIIKEIWGMEGRT